jgi:two-component system alkaline phosphatase synthesis response regulator PhoP
MPASKRILVADDSETITTLLATALRESGYDVTTASDGNQAYELGVSSDFDLVIIDQLMPGLLGLEVIERWRSDGIDPEVIVLTGVDDERIVVESFDLGADDFVRKPFRLPELIARIGRRLND